MQGQLKGITNDMLTANGCWQAQLGVGMDGSGRRGAAASSDGGRSEDEQWMGDVDADADAPCYREDS